mgnify:FL=1
MLRNKWLLLCIGFVLVASSILFFIFIQAPQLPSSTDDRPRLALQKPNANAGVRSSLEQENDVITENEEQVGNKNTEKAESKNTGNEKQKPKRQLKNVNNDIFFKFVTVHREELKEEFDKQLAAFESTRDAGVAYELSKLYAQCAAIPQDRTAFEQWVHERSNRLLERGKSNGELAEAESRWEKNYRDCQRVPVSGEARDYEKEALSFLEEAAYAGNSNAVYELATTDAASYLAKDKTPDEFNQLKNDIGEMLLNARSSCDPFIFSTLAGGRGKNENWVLELKVPEAGFVWANYWTMAAIYIRNIEVDDGRRQQFADNLRELEKKYSMNAQDIDVAKKNAKRYFKQFCTEKNRGAS